MAYQKKEHAVREDRGEFSARRRPELPANDKIDLNDVELLKHFVTEYGKILPGRAPRAQRRADGLGKERRDG